MAVSDSVWLDVGGRLSISVSARLPGWERGSVAKQWKARSSLIMDLKAKESFGVTSSYIPFDSETGYDCRRRCGFQSEARCCMPDPGSVPQLSCHGHLCDRCIPPGFQPHSLLSTDCVSLCVVNRAGKARSELRPDAPRKSDSGPACACMLAPTTNMQKNCLGIEPCSAESLTPCLCVLLRVLPQAAGLCAVSLFEHSCTPP